MKRLIITLLILNLSYVCYAKPSSSNVKDSNSGNTGDILINDGSDGHTGEWKDSSSFKGDKGDKGDTGENGTDGVNGADGKKGDKGSKGDKGEQGRGIEDAREVQFEGVLKATRKTETSIYAIQDFNNDRNTIGIKFKFYFGKSYAEQVEDKLNKRIDELEKKLTPTKFEEDNMVVVPTENGFKIERKF